MSKHKKHIIIKKYDGDHDIEKELDEHCDCGDECDCGSECDCGCDCCGDGLSFHRKFLTKEEQIAMLESYLAELKLEVQAVEENLADLKK